MFFSFSLVLSFSAFFSFLSISHVCPSTHPILVFCPKKLTMISIENPIHQFTVCFGRSVLPPSTTNATSC
uniref:Putative secreted protein n=1 Tax=Anopheles darlingi TaxID=43151 RepID=A0A2M4D3Q1_ANODA